MPRFTLNMAPSWPFFPPLSLCCRGTFCDEEEEENYAVPLVLFPLHLLPPSSSNDPPREPDPQRPRLSLSLPSSSNYIALIKMVVGGLCAFFRSGRKRQDPQHTSWFSFFFLHVLPLGVLRVSVRARVGDGRRRRPVVSGNHGTFIIIIDVLCDFATKREIYISDVVVDSSPLTGSFGKSTVARMSCRWRDELDCWTDWRHTGPGGWVDDVHREMEQSTVKADRRSDAHHAYFGLELLAV